MQDALRSETQFWLVTPKASLAGVSGLDALVGGNYIGMMPGKGEPQDHFVALDTQPKYRLNNGDLMIHLQAPDLGSLNSGSWSISVKSRLAACTTTRLTRTNRASPLMC